MKPTTKDTKAGVAAFLRHAGYKRLPRALCRVKPATAFTESEADFGRYLIYDTDFGGAWNDTRQISMHLS